MSAKPSRIKRIVFMIVGFLPLASHAVLRGNPEGIDLSAELGLPAGDLATTVINFVKWALGFLGLVSVIMMIYGGYRYLTAGGNEESLEKAKKIIKNALIGLVIVLLSYAIALFVFTITQDEFKTLP